MEIKKNLFDSLGEYKAILHYGAAIIYVPLIILIVIALIYFPYSTYFNGNICKDINCIEIFFKENFSPLSWFSSWLGVAYNLATIFGIFIAVLTYKKNSESQSMVNHFSNLGLFNTYVTEEIKKLDYLHLSSFDLVMWYTCIYDESKNGSLECSNKYANIIKSYSDLIEKSNQLRTIGPKSGYNYKKHQAEAREILKEFGVNFEDATRTGFKEIEDQILLLLNKVNISFVCSSKLTELPEASYK